MILKEIDYLITISKIILIIFLFTGLTSADNNEAYFQQYVNYDIDVKLDVDYHKLNVNETLLYTNNSPDTLKEIYFYVYMNKYRKKSLALPELLQDKGSITIHQVQENDSSNINGLIDETIFHVSLHNTLYPGYSVRFKFDFTVILPRADGRLGYFGEHFDVGNWYVTPAVYDKQGWHLNQHLDNEFYQEWGDYEVKIHVPKGYMVGATGNLLNPTEAYTDTGFHIQNYYLEEEDASKTLWHFEAKNVHDFAWTTDPAYKLMQSEWNGITFNVLVLDYNATSWKEVTEWGPKALQFLSENFGSYPYDQMTIADTYIKSGGIEYPQITFINDMIHPEYQNADFRTTIIHEMAHNWYYGILGSNQTEKGWMDEGFTTFAEIKTVESLFGRYNNFPPDDRGWFFKTFSVPDDDRSMNARSYVKLAKFGFDNDHINMHPDYMGSEAYTLEYDKSAMVLFMLEYTIGDSLFKQAMMDYYDKWKFKHPAPENFISSVEQTANRELDWFFEQWLNTNRKLDYAVTDIEGEWKNVDSIKKYQCEIEFARIGKIFMPIDFDVHLENGDIDKYQIPIDNFPKNEKDRRVIPYWHFSQKNYSAKIYCDDEVEKVIIDPSLRLMDINMLNNTSDCIPVQEIHFMKYASSSPPLNKYVWEFWPTAFYNDIDKLKLGANLNGGFLDIDHKIDLWLWYKTAWGNVDFDFNYRTPVDWIGKLTHIYLNAFTLDGRQGGEISITHLLDKVWKQEPRYKIEAGLAHHKLFENKYLMNIWDFGNVNTIFFNWSSETTYYSGWNPKNKIQLNFISSVFTEQFNFSQIYLQWQYKIWQSYTDWEIDCRLFAGHSNGNTPVQYLFNLSGDNSWGEFQQSFYRSKGSLPYPWKRTGHLYKQGSGNVRGYSLRHTNKELYASNIAAFNIDISLPNPLEQFYIPVIEDVYPAVFSDIGMVWEKDFPSFKSYKKSIGFSLVWNSYYFVDYVFNLEKIRFDFPIWLSHVPSTEKNLEFRWLIRFDFRY
jgi:aminopeptidase N